MIFEILYKGYMNISIIFRTFPKISDEDPKMFWLIVDKHLSAPLTSI